MSSPDPSDPSSSSLATLLPSSLSPSSLLGFRNALAFALASAIADAAAGLSAAALAHARDLAVQRLCSLAAPATLAPEAAYDILQSHNWSLLDALRTVRSDNARRDSRLLAPVPAHLSAAAELSIRFHPDDDARALAIAAGPSVQPCAPSASPIHLLPNRSLAAPQSLHNQQQPSAFQNSNYNHSLASAAAHARARAGSAFYPTPAQRGPQLERLLPPTPQLAMASPTIITRRNIPNTGNTCYLGSVIAALFADWDAWDGLLEQPPARVPHKYTTDLKWPGLPDERSPGGPKFPQNSAVVDPVEAMQHALRTVVNGIRQGDTVDGSAVENVRRTARQIGFNTRMGQEDAAEFFVTLVDSLGAPFLPLTEHLHYELYGANSMNNKIPDNSLAQLSAQQSFPSSKNSFDGSWFNQRPASIHAPSNTDDQRMGTERLLWLSFPENVQERQIPPVPLNDLLQAYFFGDRLTGLRRNSAIVEAWKHRLLVPEYSPLSETGDVSGINDAAAFRTVALPFALKRYTIRELSGNIFFGSTVQPQKSRVPVDIPYLLDFRDFVETMHAGSYALVLRSVVVHIGQSVGSGHYITYTRDPFRDGDNSTNHEWLRWNDLGPRLVERIPDIRHDPIALEHIQRDSYLIFYELVPGDGSVDPRKAFFDLPGIDTGSALEDDGAIAATLQADEMIEAWQNQLSQTWHF